MIDVQKVRKAFLLVIVYCILLLVNSKEYIFTSSGTGSSIAEIDRINDDLCDSIKFEIGFPYKNLIQISDEVRRLLNMKVFW